MEQTQMSMKQYKSRQKIVKLKWLLIPVTHVWGKRSQVS